MLARLASLLNPLFGGHETFATFEFRTSSNEGQSMNPDRSKGFARVLKSWDVLALSFGAMIGWGWVLLSGDWLARGGSLGAMVAFVIGGGAIFLMSLLYAELAAAMPKVGGEHVYTHRALGPGASFACTWAILMAYVGICLFESVALPTALEYLIPAIRSQPLWEVQGSTVNLGFVLVGLTGAIVMTWINVVGIRTAATIQSAVTLVIVLSGLLLLVGAISFGDLERAKPWFVDGSTGIMAVLIMVPAMLVGFDVIPQSAEEIDLAPNRIGRLLVFSVVIAVLWYALVTLSVSMSASVNMGGDLAAANAAAALWRGDWAGQILVIGGIGGILTSWIAFMIGGSRVMYALSQSGSLPAIFSRLHPRYGTPYVAVLAIGFLSCVSPLFGRTIIVWLVDVSSFAIVVAYLFVAVAFLALRRYEPEMPRPFKVPAGNLIGIVAVVLSVAFMNLYLPWSPSALVWPYEWLMVFLWVGIGLVVYVWSRSSD